MQKMGYQELGYNKKYYDNKPHEVTLGDWKFLILKGIKSSISILERGLMINLDYNLRITRFYNLWEEFVYLRDMGKKADDIIEENVIGKSFILLHANHRLITVSEVDSKMKITDAFPNKKFKNYADYFKKRYNYELDDKNQFFCVNIQKNYKFPKNTEKNLIKRDRRGREYVEQSNYYPSQTLRPTGMMEEQKKDRKSMQAFSKYTKLFPDQRMEKISNFIKLNNNLNPSAKNNKNKRSIDMGGDIRLVIEQEDNIVDGTLYSYPQIKSGSGNMKPNPKNGNYVMKDNIVDKGFVLKNYALVYDKFQSKNLNKVKDGLQKCSKAYGVKVRKPSVSFQIDSRNVDPKKLLERILDEDDEVEMVLFVVGSRNRIYDVIKNYFTKQDISTQFFTNISHRTNLSVFSKVLLQKVAKLDGVLWEVETAFEKKSELNCIMSFDIVHSRKGLIVSLVYSMDKKLTKFWSFVDKVKLSTKKNTRLQIAEKISELFAKACEEFQVYNKKNPSNIIVYRIGSGNSSGLDEDLKFEAVLCQEKLESLMGYGKESKLIYFAVSRQINERVFDYVRGGAKNPRGGLIVHEGIVRQDRYEFFMVAQNVNQGSAMPTSYSCVFNNTDLKQDEIYKNTYYQTFNYPNWQGPVKVPGVAMNALKLSQFWADNVKSRRNQLDKCFGSQTMYYL
jgi:aubergine-like protein